MTDGLGAGARGVEVGGLGGGEDGEGGCGEAFGGEVDMAARQGGGGGEEDRLGEGLDGEEGVREGERGVVWLWGLTFVIMSGGGFFSKAGSVMTMEQDGSRIIQKRRRG